MLVALTTRLQNRVLFIDQMLRILFAALLVLLATSFERVLPLLLLLDYVESGLRYDWLHYPVDIDLHLDSVPQILPNSDAFQVLLQLKKPDPVATLLWRTLFSM